MIKNENMAVVSIVAVEWIVDVFGTEMVSDDDATPVVVIPVDVSVGTSVAGYVVVMDVCSSVVLYLRST
jgi:hypothetical protein